MITRAVEQTRGLITRLELMGATVLLFPAVSFSEPCDPHELDQSIHSLAAYDWILFTSANAARFFAARCRKLGIAPSQGVRLSVAPQSARQPQARWLRKDFPVDHVAREFIGTALARELSASLAGKKVLLPRSERARVDLTNALKAFPAR